MFGVCVLCVVCCCFCVLLFLCVSCRLFVGCWSVVVGRWLSFVFLLSLRVHCWLMVLLVVGWLSVIVCHVSSVVFLVARLWLFVAVCVLGSC